MKADGIFGISIHLLLPLFVCLYNSLNRNLI
jgi:hypothetical protein